MMPLSGKPALARVLERLGRARQVDEIWLATSEEASDDPIFEWAKKGSIPCVRGALEDVLSRFAKAAEASEASVLVRITADCPLLDPELVDLCVERFYQAEKDPIYVATAWPRTFPDGLDVEVFSAGQLRRAQAEAPLEDVYAREHVTPFIEENCERIAVTQRVNLSALRWTLDTADDYAVIQGIFDALVEPNGDARFDSADIYAHLLQHEDLIRTGGDSAEPLTPQEARERIELFLKAAE
jgi:spore coat polysaccharide biosynthesis protein SpsF (cytidylyltransferase family)